MTNEERSRRTDQVLPGAVQWNLGIGSEHRGDVMWRCDALRAGRLYSSTLFGSQGEAEQFAQKMRHVEPDQMFNVERILARSVWN